MTDPIRILADGTIKQINPFSGTQVWTVPGRGHRPMNTAGDGLLRVESAEPGHHCPFCERRYLETPPEKSRVARTESGWERIDALPADRLHDTVAEFRRIPNMFEILSLDYWEDNHGHRMPADVRRRMDEYLADPQGMRTWPPSRGGRRARSASRRIAGTRWRASGSWTTTTTSSTAPTT